MQEADNPRIVVPVTDSPSTHLRPVTGEGVTTLLEAPWSGRPPGIPTLDLQEET
jgi:hypothetical protein